MKKQQVHKWKRFVEVYKKAIRINTHQINFLITSDEI